jgi:hypothetical protein
MINGEPIKWKVVFRMERGLSEAFSGSGDMHKFMHLACRWK